MHWSHTSRRKSTIDDVRHAITNKILDSKSVKEALAFMKARLGESRHFLASTDKPTIEDLFVVPEVDQLVFFGVLELGEYPKVSAWLKVMAKVDDRWRKACNRR